MKKLLLIAVTAIFCLPVSGYSQASEIEYLQKIFSMEKKAMAESFIQLSGSDYNAFWELYDAYEAERKALANRRVDLLKDYADQYNTLTNDQAAALAKRSIGLQKEWTALSTKYHKKISKAVDAKTAASWYQFEQYIHNAVLYDIYDSIPFVGE